MPGQKPVVCSDHREEGMVDLKHKLCVIDGCNRHPYYGEPNGKPDYCSQHKTEAMTNLRSRRCEFPGCQKQPSYAPSGAVRQRGGMAPRPFSFYSQTPRFCAEHKTQDCIDTTNKRCAFKGCRAKRIFSEGGIERLKFCIKHKDQDPPPAPVVNAPVRNQSSVPIGSQHLDAAPERAMSRKTIFRNRSARDAVSHSMDESVSSHVHVNVSVRRGTANSDREPYGSASSMEEQADYGNDMHDVGLRVVPVPPTLQYAASMPLFNTHEISLRLENDKRWMSAPETSTVGPTRECSSSSSNMGFDSYEPPNSTSPRFSRFAEQERYAYSQSAMSQHHGAPMYGQVTHYGAFHDGHKRARIEHAHQEMMMRQQQPIEASNRLEASMRPESFRYFSPFRNSDPRQFSEEHPTLSAGSSGYPPSFSLSHNTHQHTAPPTNYASYPRHVSPSFEHQHAVEFAVQHNATGPFVQYGISRNDSRHPEMQRHDSSSSLGPAFEHQHPPVVSAVEHNAMGPYVQHGIIRDDRRPLDIQRPGTASPQVPAIGRLPPVSAVLGAQQPQSLPETRPRADFRTSQDRYFLGLDIA